MLRMLLCLFLAFTALAGTTEEKILQPIMVVEDLTSNTLYTFMTNETVQLQFPTQFTAFEGKIYNRQSPFNSTNIHQDFIDNPKSYTESTICDFQPSYFEFGTEAESINFTEHKAVSHVVDWENKQVYLLTDSFSVLKSSKKDDPGFLFNSNSKFQQLGKINESSSFGGIYMNQSSKKLYVFSKNNLFVWDNSEFVSVIGYEQKQFGGDFILRKNQLYILQPYNGIAIYNFSDSKNCKLTHIVNRWGLNSISPVDFKFVRDELWVLDSDFGLYTYTLNDQTPQANNSYLVRYGKKLFFEVDKDTTFQIAFELNSDTYVAQMVMVDDVLHLNRFYDQVNGVKQIIFLEQRLIIVGQEQAMAIQHSTNPTLLTSFWQDKTFYSTIGSLGFQSSKNYHSKKGVVFTSLKTKSLSAIIYERNYARATCYFSELKQQKPSTMYIELNSTLCEKNSRASMSSHYCNIRYNVNYRIVDTISSLVNFWFGVFVMIFSCVMFFSMIRSAKAMRERKRQEIQQLQLQLKKRMQQQKKSKQASEEVLSHQA